MTLLTLFYSEQTEIYEGHGSQQRHSYKLSVIQLVRFLVVESTHLYLSLQLNTGPRIFLDLFQDLTALFFQ